jgi:hypothetical protein
LQAVLKGKAEPLTQFQQMLAQEARVLCERLRCFVEKVRPTKAA